MIYTKMADFGNPVIWFIFILIFAVVSYFVSQYYMKKIFVRVAYHRKGGTVDILQCMEREDRITFRTNADPLTKRVEEITITKRGLPELQTAGARTFKLYHALEGYGRTVSIWQVLEKNPTASGSGTVVATALSTMGAAFDLLQRAIGKGKSEWLLLLVIGVVMFLMGLGWGLAA